MLRNLYNKKELMYTRDLGSKGMLDSAVDEAIICRFNALEDVEAKIKDYPDQIAAIIADRHGSLPEDHGDSEAGQDAWPRPYCRGHESRFGTAELGKAGLYH